MANRETYRVKWIGPLIKFTSLLDIEVKGQTATIVDRETREVVGEAELVKIDINVR